MDVKEYFDKNKRNFLGVVKSTFQLRNMNCEAGDYVLVRSKRESKAKSSYDVYVRLPGPAVFEYVKIFDPYASWR